MRKKLLFALTAVAACLTLNPSQGLQAVNFMDDITPTAISNHVYPKTISDQLLEIKTMLVQNGGRLNPAVIDKVMSILQCSSSSYLENNNMLTIIDYSLPSNEKRLWVFDVTSKKLLFNTYVSHGIKSGVSLSTLFSNKYDSKASSIGVFKTDKSYYGRHGLSLKLNGLDYGFNDNADGRAVVMHGGWYVDERFIKKYGRAGRSWGCPAVPSNLTESIINTIKERSIFIGYYPSDRWFLKSKFLKCDIPNTAQQNVGTNQSIGEIERRDDILFADINSNNKFTDSKPVVVISAASYERLLHSKAPLTRMLRRQINDMEYIALSGNELQNIANNHDEAISHDDKTIYFVVPDIKMVRGYYVTDMKMVNLGNIKDIQSNSGSADNVGNITSYTVHFEERASIDVKPSDRFIRWIGL